MIVKLSTENRTGTSIDNLSRIQLPIHGISTES